MFTDRSVRRARLSRAVRTVRTGRTAVLRVLRNACHAALVVVAAVACHAVSPSFAAAADAPAARVADPAAITAADRAAIETVIRKQLDAFGRDDAEGAFGYATSDIRRQFRSPDNFMRMVQEQYDAVYRAAGVAFVRLARVDGHWVQTVQLVDGEGRVWRALFTMRRQADRSWKVGGCELVQTSALAT